MHRLDTEYERYLQEGDFINAEKTAMLFLQYQLSDYYKGLAYSWLATIYTRLGRYNDAISSLKKIESLKLSEGEKYYMVPYVYASQAVVFERRRSYFQAIEYTDKAIRLCKEVQSDEKYFKEALATSYHNMGTYYNPLGEYNTALKYFALSMEFKEDNGLAEKAMTLNTMAKSYVGLGDFIKAEDLFRKSIETGISENGNKYFKLIDLCYNYGEFLQNQGRFREAFAMFNNSLKRSLELYGSKHNQTSVIYGFIARNHLLSGNVDSAIYFYQKSLISIVSTFNETDIAKNPEIDSSFLDTKLMNSLKGKSNALEVLASRQSGDQKLKTLELSLNTIVLALDFIDAIRNNDPSEENMMYITGIEKETYLSALRIASSIYHLSNDELMLKRMYSIALRAKAAVLKNQITGNNLLYSSALPEKIRTKLLNLSSNIAGYNKLILDENSKVSPNASMISLWQDDLFEMKKQKEGLADSISKVFPQYFSVLRKTTPVPLELIQKELEKDETIIDYFISNKYVDGKRKLYMFLVDRKKISLIERDVDSLFSKNASVLHSMADPLSDKRAVTGYFRSCTSALYYFYQNLILPAEGFLRGKRLIIIPDEEINWLPFEAFLKEAPGKDKNDFDGLHFLLKDYKFSHSYSASLLVSDPQKSGGTKVYSFSPYYGVLSGYDSLDGAMGEINNISNLMGGESFTFNKATKAAFLKSLSRPGIFHLAMHSITDSINSLYSYLQFDANNEGSESAKLYNYEISLSKVNSPLIVLSSCNSGTGNMFSGEGQLSLARSFILAGASSVVKTAWEVNDDSGSEIITRFYYYLSKGKSKDKALQLAKLDYIDNASPMLRDPYYWAAYEILGDNGPISGNEGKIVTIVTILIILSGVLYYYSRRRKIFPASPR
ncbi:MAG TPA: CHAT domain-containing tetratricopeptide repeat protein [Bacteroidales bacterium]|nr:CHAT domain-containing tetratricopeptide repeat protein [Bacteroidales bacterium]